MPDLTPGLTGSTGRRVRVFKLDLAEVLDFKQRVLAGRRAVPRCARLPVPADLREDWGEPLIRAGLHLAEPTAWLLEGLLIYLSAPAVITLLTRLGELSAATSQLAFECEDASADTLREQARRLPAMAAYATLWQGGLPDVPGWLAARGWLTKLHDRADLAAGYGRPVTGPSRGGFVTASRCGGQESLAAD